MEEITDSSDVFTFCVIECFCIGAECEGKSEEQKSESKLILVNFNFVVKVKHAR